MTAGATEPVRVSVRALCAFAARAGDLDHRFRPGATALQGQHGHARVAARRAGGQWRTEVALSLRHGALLVQGRADLVDVSAPRVDEVKTIRGGIDRVRDNHRALARAQARCYAHMLCVRDALPGIDVGTVHLDLDDEREHVELETLDAAALAGFFATLCARYVDWAQAQARHLRSRDEALRALRFPLPEFRAGQRELAEAVYRAHRDDHVLMVEAPTGIGKSLGTLFPALKAFGAAGLDRLYFLCARTSGRASALAALAQLPQAGLRTIELVSREHACVHPQRACHGDSCPLARGFFDRLPAAREAVAARWTQAAGQPTGLIREVARTHDVCPYHLQHELVRWADVVVADYNHYFDVTAGLYAAMLDEDWRVALLVDEAHNLVERVRAMYTVALSGAAIESAIARLDAPAGRALRAVQTLIAVRGRDGARYAAVPPDESLRTTVQAAAAALADWIGQRPQAAPDATLQTAFDVIAFAALLERFDAHSLLDLRRMTDDDRHLTLRNVVPAPFVRPRLLAARGASLFSGTFAPLDHHRRLLGLDAPSLPVRALGVGSPFRAGQIDVRITRGLSMRQTRRERSLPHAARVIVELVRARPGNHLVFTSSHALLARLADAVHALDPSLAQWRQNARMSDVERDAFLSRFAPGGTGIGFAVLGGVFGEGIDLPGERLIGVAIVTLGLVAPDDVNEAFRRHLQHGFGRGADDVYLYPAIRRVVQAAGRLIRTPHDRGTLVLIDERFDRRDVRALLPPWWPPARPWGAPDDPAPMSLN